MLKPVSLSSLHVGAFLVRSGRGTFGDPLIEHDRLIASKEDLLGLKDILRDPIVIDTVKSFPAPPDEPDGPGGKGGKDVPGGQAAVEGFSLEEVIKVYADIVGRMKGLMQGLRRGGTVDLRKAGDTVDMVVQLALRSPAYLKRVMTLQRFDEPTFAHSANVCGLAVLLGTSMGLGRAEMYPLGLGALLHDVGKMQVPEALLNKPGRLTAEEDTILRRHTVLGYAMLRDIPFIHPDVPPAALDHHERLDGTGYPRGLRCDDIGLPARLVAVCDAYEDRTGSRPHGAAESPHEAIQAIQTLGGHAFTPALVDAFVGLMGLYPEGTWVQLTSGQIGQVIRTSREHQDRPVVRIVADRKWVPCRPVEIDLAAPHSVAGLDIARVVQPDRLPKAVRE
jgi:putative nucleotidyltransferase with HDIG domain